MLRWLSSLLESEAAAGDVLESQEEAGAAQASYGRLSLKWGEAHEEELKLSRAAAAGRSSGLAWAFSPGKGCMGPCLPGAACKECWQAWPWRGAKEKQSMGKEH